MAKLEFEISKYKRLMISIDERYRRQCRGEMLDESWVVVVVLVVFLHEFFRSKNSISTTLEQNGGFFDFGFSF